jgi:protein-S-isoprenylcysteine O-methyltransferase Ste14
MASKPRRIVPPVYFALHVLVMVLLQDVMPGPTWLRRPWTFAGAAPALVGFVLGLLAVRHFKSVGTTLRPFQESSSLVVAGPFRITRNPMYLGMALILIGLAVFLGTTTPCVGIPSFVFIIDRLIIPHEEAALADKFGGDYARYRTQVRRWI